MCTIENLLDVIKNSTMQRIVKLLLYCEQTDNYSEENQVHFFNLHYNS